MTTHSREAALPQRSGSISFLRIIALIAVFAVTIWAFWANNSKRYVNLRTGTRLVDAAEAFSPEEHAEIIKIILRFDENFSLKLRVHTENRLFTSVDAVDDILVGFCPGKQQMVVFMSPLLRQALGEGMAAQMREMVTNTDFDQGWPQAAIKSLLLLEARLQPLWAE